MSIEYLNRKRAANCLNACDTPSSGAPAGAPSGTIYWAVPGSHGRVLYIVP